MYLKDLCELDGTSGDESAVRTFILDKITPYADNIKIDSIGNIIAFKKGKNSTKTAMIDAHMDEVGFIISEITEKGFLKFKAVGGIDTKVIISKRVRIGKNKIPGVIGMKAIHLQTKDERDSVPKKSSLYIDIGAKDKEEAETVVSLGDYASFDTDYAEIGIGKVKAKAIDDRAGCAILIDLIKETPCYDTYFTFTAQEEVGLRGAKIATARIKPDIALSVESTTCSDVAGTNEQDYVTTLGRGVAVSYADRRTIVPEDFCDWLVKKAKENNIAVQYKACISGGNNAGAIHTAAGGVKTASISVPTRYIHSPACIADLGDIEATKELARLFLQYTNEII